MGKHVIIKHAKCTANDTVYIKFWKSPPPPPPRIKENILSMLLANFRNDCYQVELHKGEVEKKCNNKVRLISLIRHKSIKDRDRNLK